jgi:ABC-type Fe3+-hydroxamate transport system substrate-binding protein
MDSRFYTQLQDIPVAEPPKRVVSLVPSITESLFDLAVGHTVVGRTEYCIYPVGKVNHIPTVGGTKNPDLEKIVALKPDLVMMNQEENRKEDADWLQEKGIPVWVTFPKTVQDAFNVLWNIMYVFDNPAMVERVRLIEYSYDWVSRMSEQYELTQPVKVFAPIWIEPLMTFNGDTFTHDLIKVCGGTNIFADRERLFPLKADLGETSPLSADDPRVQGRDVRYPRVSWDEVVSLQPDVILLPSEPYLFTEEHLPLFQQLDVPASQHQRIHLVDGSYLTWHGTRVAYALNTLPSLIRPIG